MFSFSHSDTLLSEEAKNWKKPKCPPARERVHKLQYIHIMENYSARERIKLVKNSNVDESLHITLSKRSQTNECINMILFT